MAAATDQQHFRFNKYGSIGKSAGFLIVASGFIIRAVVRGYEGEFTFSNLVSQVTPFGAILFLALLTFMGVMLVKAVLKPQNQVSLSADEITFHGAGKLQRVDRREILAVAAFSEEPRFAMPGRRAPLRSIVVFSDSGSNFGPIPKGVRWLSTGTVDGTGRRDLVEEILADSNVLAQFPDDEFGDSMREKLTASPAQRIKALKTARPGVKAMVIPMPGMPRETEDELRDALPNWI